MEEGLRILHREEGRGEGGRGKAGEREALRGNWRALEERWMEFGWIESKREWKIESGWKKS